MATPYGGNPVAQNNQTITAEELQFMVPDYSQTPLYRSDVGSDGGGKTENQGWNRHVSDGRILSQGNALISRSGSLARTYMPRHDLQNDILRNIAGLPTSNTLVNGATQRKTVYVHPDNEAPKIITKTLWHGTPNGSDLMTGVRISSISEEINRSADGGTLSGNIQFDANDFVTGPIWTPGASAHNARYLFELLKGVADDFEGTITVNGGAADDIVIPADSTAVEIKGIVETAAAGVTCTVVNKEGTPYVVGTDKAFIIVFSAPVNARIIIEQTDGRRWSLFEQAIGGAKLLLQADGPFFEPNQVILYLAKDLDELNAIDWDDLPDRRGNGGDPMILHNAHRLNFSMSALWNPSFSLNGKRIATDLVPGARTVESSLTVPKILTPGSDYKWIKETEESCMANGFYIVRRVACLELGYDDRRFGYFGRSSNAAFEIDNGEDVVSFSLERYQTPDGSPSLWWEHFEPNP